MQMLTRRALEISSPWVLVALSATRVFAQRTTDIGFADIGDAVTIIFRAVVTIATVLFVILFLVGGIQYLGSFGNEETTTKARRLIIDAIVGLVIVLAAFAIGSFILEQLGAGGLDDGAIPIR